MPVVGFLVHKIEAEKDKDAVISEINVNSSPTIHGMKEIDLDALDKKALAIEFDYTTVYSPNVGSIKIIGELLYVSSDNKKLLDDWEKKKILPKEDSLEILNYIFRRCVLKSLSLSDELQLPAPISLPFIRAAPENFNQSQSNKQPKKAEPEDDDQTEKELKEKIKKLTSK